MDVDEFLRKSYILGGHCPDCGGFLFTEVVKTNPLLIQQRCLKCGNTKDITEDVTKGNNYKTEKYFICGQKDPKNLWVERIDSPDENFINWYKKMIVNGDIE